MSDAGLGSTLSPVDEQGDKHPVAFASHKMLPRQNSYSKCGEGVPSHCMGTAINSSVSIWPAVLSAN